MATATKEKQSAKKIVKINKKSKVVSKKKPITIKKAVEIANKVIKDKVAASEKRVLNDTRESADSVASADLQGTLLYTVNFIEYVDGKKHTDIPIFLASSPEWAIGFCKAHTDYAVKYENKSDKQWWYFTISEMAINESQSAQGWVATIDWNGRIAHETYHFDKGYKNDYKKDHVIYEQSVDAQREGESKEEYEKRFKKECEACMQNERNEEEKIAERTRLAIEEAKVFIPQFFNKVKTIEVKQEGDWFKLNIKGDGKRLTDQEFAVLHSKFGVAKGNRILFHSSK